MSLNLDTKIFFNKAVWGFFESTTKNAIGSASELRVAYHLGNIQPDMAKLSAYKSILLAAILTSLSSFVLMSVVHVHQLPPLLTYDPTIFRQCDNVNGYGLLGNRGCT
jgi:Na+-driven multidrug efflux pump